MSSGRQTPIGTPQLGTNAGLTPQMSIVDANGRPTTFFFRWLLTIGGAALTSNDLAILESFDPGADAALTEGAIAGALEGAAIAAGFDYGAAGRAELETGLENAFFAGAVGYGAGSSGPQSDQRALEALLIADAPVAPVTPETRDVLANIPTGLNQGDTGKLFYATDFEHTYRWTGAAWTYGDGELGSGFVEWFMVAPRAGAWQLCDGSAAISESRADGTAGPLAIPGLAAGTVPNLVSLNAYIRGNVAANGSVTPATGPTFASGSTAPTDLHPSAGAMSAGAGGVAGFDNPHSHALPAFATTGEPAHINAMPYYRL